MIPQIRQRDPDPALEYFDSYAKLSCTAPRDLLIAVRVVAIIVILASAAGFVP